MDVVADRRAIWRGSATTRLDRDRNEAQRKQVIEDAVKKLIDKLPAK